MSIDHLIDEVAWAKTSMLIAAATAPGSADREREMATLRAAVATARRSVDAAGGRGETIPESVLVELRVSELAIPKLELGAVLRR